MAIYWIDPYIDTPKGGIHGTTDTVTRDGSYGAPFGILQIVNITATLLTSINGITINSGDEIRIKGQPLADFYFNIGTTGNLIDGVNASSSNIIFDSATYLSAVNLYRASLAKSGVFVVHDDGLMGSDQFILFQTTGAFYTQTTTPAVSTSSSYAQNAYFRGTNGKSVSVGFIDSDYFFDQFGTFGNTSSYWFRGITAGATITSGWIDSTTRGGVSLIISGLGGQNIGTNRYIGNSAPQADWDCPELHFLFYSTTGDYANASTTMYFYHYDNTSLKLGSLLDHGDGAWGYVNFANNTGTTNLEITNLLHGRYVSFSGSSDSTTSVKIYNGIYYYVQSNYSNYKLLLGNFFVYNNYSSSAMIYNPSSIQQLEILDDAWIYGYVNCPPLFNVSINGFTAGSNITTVFTATKKYPDAISVSSSGPQILGVKSASTEFVDTSNNVLLEPPNWYENLGVKPSNASNTMTTYGYGQWNHTAGVLDTQSQNYANMNANIQYLNVSYISPSYYSNVNLNFISNTYDKKPIGLFLYETTSTNVLFPTIICYNNANDDLVVQCSTYANYGVAYYSKNTVIETPDVSTGTTLSISLEVEMSTAFTTSFPIMYLYHTRLNSDGLSAPMSRSSLGNIHTYTLNISTSLLDPNSKYVGLYMKVYNTGGYENKYYIRNIQAVVT